jgi:hypothetical protein
VLGPQPFGNGAPTGSLYGEIGRRRLNILRGLPLSLRTVTRSYFQSCLPFPSPALRGD